MARSAEVHRSTKETNVRIVLSLEGNGVFHGSTSIGFFDHMLTLFARHGGMSLSLDCKGDTQVDGHHTVEDVGIVLGTAIAQALGEKRGIRRYAAAFVPMDESLARVVVDLSGRPYCVIGAELTPAKIGDFDVELAWEFFRALSVHAKCNLHIDLLRAGNAHHAVEACFKAAARAFSEAWTVVGSESGEIPSTKGVL
ncbi:MAG TPA: imidazoleglycerol-phosphate dehydratase HisB [Candidatus Latescibacteria bacterium]|nr:imidazoleglycerol-phosphate dehydratase HisB [Candidatus Latescibacterota bacterium]